MKPKTALLLFVLLAAVIVPLWPDYTVSSHPGHDPLDHIYFADDPATQNSAWSGTENWVYKWWGIGQGSMWWWADPNAQGFKQDAGDATERWKGAVSQLLWLEVPTDTEANLVFWLANCPAPVPAKACFKVGFVENTWWDSDRKARFWTRAEIYINPTVTWGTSGRTGALAHEIGHGYGLHERYVEGQGCNNAEVTVMDFLKEVPPGSGLWVHCDAISPTSVDIGRISTYWSQGKLDDWTASGYGTPLGTFTWKDYAWAEGTQTVVFYSWAWDGEAWAWIPYEQRWPTANIGVHKVTEDRTLTSVVDIRNLPGIPIGWTYHTICGWAWHRQFGAYGPGDCYGPDPYYILLYK